MKQYRTADEWRNIIANQQSSGLSIPQFCKQNKIGDAGFYYNLSKHADLRPKKKNGQFTRLGQIKPEKLKQFKPEFLTFTLDGNQSLAPSAPGKIAIQYKNITLTCDSRDIEAIKTIMRVCNESI